MPLAGPGTDSGTFDYFTDEINGEEGASRSDYTASEDDNVIVQAVQGDPGALGYFGYTYYEENQDTLKALEVDGGEGCVAPSADTARDGSYTPLSRPLFVYVKNESLAKPEVVAFLRFYLENLDVDRRAGAVHHHGRDDGTGDERHARVRDRGGGRSLGLATPDAAVRAQPIRLRAERRRYGEDLVKVLLGLCAAVSVATTIGIIVGASPARDRVLPRGQLHRLHHGDGLGPALHPAALRRPAARRRDAHGHVLGLRRLHALRPRRCDLPERVRERARPQVAEAGARDPGRASRRSSTASSP